MTTMEHYSSTERLDTNRSPDGTKPSGSARCQPDLPLHSQRLKSSGIEVDIVQDDFSSWYEQFAIGEADKWYSNQLVSSEGADQCITCEFGTTHLPADLNRQNFNMCQLIEDGAAGIRDGLVENPSPWDPEYIQRCVAFSNVRKFVGGHGDWWVQFRGLTIMRAQSSDR